MNKLIALRSGIHAIKVILYSEDLASQLKQQALLFDRIGILHLNRLIGSREEADSDEFTEDLEFAKSELSWLREKDIIFEPVMPTSFPAQGNEDLFSMMQKNIEEVNQLERKMSSRRNKSNISKIADEFLDRVIEFDSISLRLLSRKMEMNEDITAVTTL